MSMKEKSALLKIMSFYTLILRILLSYKLNFSQHISLYISLLIDILKGFHSCSIVKFFHYAYRHVEIGNRTIKNNEEFMSELKVFLKNHSFQYFYRKLN